MVTETFGATERLLQASVDSLSNIKIYIEPTSNVTEVEICRANVTLINQRQLLAIKPVQPLPSPTSVLRATAEPFIPSIATLHSMCLFEASPIDSSPSPGMQGDDIDLEIMKALNMEVEHSEKQAVAEENPIVDQSCVCMSIDP